MGTCDADIILNFAAEMGSNPELYIIFLDTRRLGWLEMKLEMQMAVSKGQKAHHTISDNI